MSDAVPVLVTGAASGIGAALVARLRDEGLEVIGWDLADGVDVADDAAVAAAAAELPPRLGAVVNCAGISSRGTLEEVGPAEFARVVQVNLVGTAIVAARLRSRLAGGVFVAIGSVAGSVPMAERAAYCSSKAGVAMLAKVLGNEWAADGIQVLCVSPGFTDAGMAVRGAAEGGTALDRILERTPTGALVPVDDLLDVLVLAVTGRLRAVTGSEILVDGGFAAGTRLT